MLLWDIQMYLVLIQFSVFSFWVCLYYDQNYILWIVNFLKISLIYRWNAFIHTRRGADWLKFIEPVTGHWYCQQIIEHYAVISIMVWTQMLADVCFKLALRAKAIELAKSPSVYGWFSLWEHQSPSLSSDLLYLYDILDW